MEITQQEVEKVANLARLALTDGEKAAFAKQLSQILTHEETLKQYDTRGVEPTATMPGHTNVFHLDDVRPSLLCNFPPVIRAGYRVGVPRGGFYRERINSDAAIYGGSNVGNAGNVLAEPVPTHGHPFSLQISLPPLATLVFRPDGVWS